MFSRVPNATLQPRAGDWLGVKSRINDEYVIGLSCNKKLTLSDSVKLEQLKKVQSY